MYTSHTSMVAACYVFDALSDEFIDRLLVEVKRVLKPGGRIHLALPGDAGYTLGPVVGRTAALNALSQPTEIDVAPYSADRFRA